LRSGRIADAIGDVHRPVLRRFRVTATAAGVALLSVSAAHGWLASGHRRVTVEAIGQLPATVPAFVREGAATAGGAAIDPDLWRNRDTPELADREAPEHFLDLELLRGSELPERRSEYLRLLGRLRVNPQQIGAMPYAIVESAERLALCFAEHRRRPADAATRSNCLLIAGWLSHYAADLTQPLHTTVHHDGRALPGGRSPETGIHRKVDDLLELARPLDGGAGTFAEPALSRGDASELWPAVLHELAVSHALVDSVYALEPKLAPGSKPKPDADLVAFATERERAAVRFVAALILWSWERSAKLELPEWLER
jgi:hypothetical protein